MRADPPWRPPGIRKTPTVSPDPLAARVTCGTVAARRPPSRFVPSPQESSCSEISPPLAVFAVVDGPSSPPPGPSPRALRRSASAGRLCGSDADADAGAAAARPERPALPGGGQHGEPRADRGRALRPGREGERRWPPGDVLVRTSSLLFVVVPPLPAGTYGVRVTSSGFTSPNGLRTTITAS